MPTNNKGLNQPVLSSAAWGTPLNDNAAIIDRAMGSFTTIPDLTGIISLTLAQCQNMCLKSNTSAFLSNVTFEVPSGIAGQWVFVNQSAVSAFSLIVKNAASGTSVSIPNGQTRTVYSDGSVVFFVDTQSPSNLQNLAIGNGFATTSATCTGTNATVNFSGGFLVSVGQTISIKGVTPVEYNGIWTVTASSVGSVTFVVPATIGNQTVPGVLYYGAITGSTLNLSGKGDLNGLATQSEAEAGTNNQTIMTPLRVEQHTLSNDIGWGQTWQQLTGSRISGTSYRNTTTRPIMVVVAGTKSSGTRRLEVSNDEITWVELGSVSSDPGGGTVSGIIPVGTYYRMTTGVTIYAWAELR